MNRPVDTFEAWLTWEGGSLARLEGEEAPPIGVTHPRGHPGRRAEAWTPEELLVGAIEASVMHTFFEAAQTRGLEVLMYESNGMARVRQFDDGGSVLLDFVLRPRLAVANEDALQLARELFHQLLPPLVQFLKTEIRIVPVIEVWNSRKSQAQPPSMGA